MAAPVFTKKQLDLPPYVQSYLNAIVQTCNASGWKSVSVVLFGSAAKGGFTRQVSDVDLIIVLADGASRHDRVQAREVVDRLEIEHGFRQSAGTHHLMQTFAEHMIGADHSCFVCTPSDLLSGDVGRILNLKAAEALFVDRVVLANIIASSVTVWGEDLIPSVRTPDVHLSDVLKACFAFTNRVLMSMIAYAFLPDATRYAMVTLKHSLHSCYFCYHRETNALAAEVTFFETRLGGSQTLKDLLLLRGQYRKSFGFVLRCLPTVLHLHLRTAMDNSFPLKRPA